MIKKRAQAREGFTLIELLLVIAVISILAAIAIPNLLSSRESANETAAIGALKAIDAAEAAYRTRNTTYGTLAQLDALDLIDPALVAAAPPSGAPRSGYLFDLRIPSGTQAQFYVLASPYQLGGVRSFYTDESYVIYQNPDPAATVSGDVGGNLSSLGGNWSVIGN